MLGILFSIGTVGLWQQACSVYDASVYSYRKDQRVALAEGVMIYACALYHENEGVRRNIGIFKKHAIVIQPGFVLNKFNRGKALAGLGWDERMPASLPDQPVEPSAQVKYELSPHQELLIEVTIRVEDGQETLRWKCPVQDHIFTLYS